MYFVLVIGRITRTVWFETGFSHCRLFLKFLKLTGTSSLKMVKIDITLVKMVKITAISRATSSSPILPQLLQL